MKTTGIFTTHDVTVHCDVNEPLKFIPFGDIHYDSPAFSKDKWNEFIERAKSLKKAVFLGMGDYLDGYSASERIILASPGMHESSRERFEEEEKGRIRRLYEDIKFMEGRLIGLLGGNHYPQFSNGTNGDQYLAGLLKTDFLGVCSAIALHFKVGKRGCKHALIIFCHHGRGAGQTVGGRMNSVEKLVGIADADIYLMGDNHARGVLPLGEKLYLHTSNGHSSLCARKSWIARTGSFLRAYVNGESGYVVDRALQPASLGWVEFEVIPRRSQVGGEDHNWLDIHATQ